jgi:multidrug resistance protein, MATE family
MSTVPLHTDLRVKTSYRQIIQLTAPISIAMLIPQLNYIMNNVFIGGLGQKELGTAAVPMVYYIIFSFMGHGFANGVQSLFARRAGENDYRNFGVIFSNAALVKLIAATLGIILTFFVAPAILRATIHNPQVYEDAVRFLKIRIWGVPFYYMLLLVNSFLLGSNNTRFLMIIMSIEAAANIFFDYVLIYGKWGFPNLGFYGAAYASVLAEVIGMLVGFGVILFNGFHHKFYLIRNSVFDSSIVKRILNQSAPLVFQNFISVASWLMFFIFIVDYGEQDSAISNVMRNIFGLFGIFIWAFGQTSNSMVSNVIGQGKKELVIPLIKRITFVSLGCTLLLSVFLNIFPQFFFNIYDQSKSFTDSALPVLRVITLAALLMSAAIVWLYALTGTGNTRVNLVVEFAAIIAYVGYVWLTAKLLKTPLAWVWASEFIYWLVIMVCCYFYFKSGRWMGKKI